MRQLPIAEDPLLNPRIKVGPFYVPISISNLFNGQASQFTALVDTGATLTIAPGSALRRLGIEQASEQLFTLADGRTVQYPVGEARVTVEGISVPTLVAFGVEGTPATLGVVVLEMAGLTIDPKRQLLIKTDLLLM